jgi:protein gp37
VGEETKIQWTDHTFNPWVGCTKVAPGCANCYAEADMDKRRHFAKWGMAGTRVKTSDANWAKPLKWNRDAAATGVRARVFCSSLADVFENWKGPISNSRGEVLFDVGDQNWRPSTEINKRAFPGFSESDPDYLVTLDDVRERLFELIDNTPNLDWQLLTKRPENIRKMWHNHIDAFDQDEADIEHTIYRPNIWLGTSISDQATADKAIPELLNCRDLSPVLFASAEPLLGPINLHRLRDDGRFATAGIDGMDWVIVGGESGPGARECRPEWIRSIVDQCKDSPAICFVKQMGANVVTRKDLWPEAGIEQDIHGFREQFQGAECRIVLRDKKGGDSTEWPEELRVREFPSIN